MIEFFKNLFKKSVPSGPKYTIEYFPETDRWYPTCNGQYFYESPHSGIITLQDRLSFAMFSLYEDRALKTIARYKEQQTKATVVVKEVL